MKKSRDYIKDNPEMFNCPDLEGLEQNVDDINLATDDDDDPDSNDETITTSSSPRVLLTDQIKSVQNAVETFETKTQSKTRKKSPTKDNSKPTSEQKKQRGRPPKTN